MSGLGMLQPDELLRDRQVLWIANGSAAIGPAYERVDVPARERRIIREVTVLRIREPRRHLPLQDRFLHRLGPRTRLLIGEQRERRRLAGPVARLAILLNQRCDILGEGRGGLLPRLR